ncbi:MAG: hypothetical protein Q7S87_01325 [Agitococcus sp.]|nr:hypothetical protein [Agitococcus sp.]MDO9179167.1 hypothetical protein [Agitococcus sp.]
MHSIHPLVVSAASLPFYPGRSTSHTPGPNEVPDTPLDEGALTALLAHVVVHRRHLTAFEISVNKEMSLRVPSALAEKAYQKLTGNVTPPVVFSLYVKPDNVPELLTYIYQYAIYPNVYLEIYQYDHRPAQLWFRYSTILGGRKVAELTPQWLAQLTDKMSQAPENP